MTRARRRHLFRYRVHGSSRTKIRADLQPSPTPQDAGTTTPRRPASPSPAARTSPEAAAAAGTGDTGGHKPFTSPFARMAADCLRIRMTADLDPQQLAIFDRIEHAALKHAAGQTNLADVIRLDPHSRKARA